MDQMQEREPERNKNQEECFPDINSEQGNMESRRNEKVSFLDILVKEVPYEYRFKKKYKFRKSSCDSLLYEIDDSHRFRNIGSITRGDSSSRSPSFKNEKQISIKEFFARKKLENKIEEYYNKNGPKIITDKQTEKYTVDLIDWDMVSDKPYVEEIPHRCQIKGEIESCNQVLTKDYINRLIDSNWEENVILNDDCPFRDYLTLYINDPNLIFDQIEEKKLKTKKKNAIEKIKKNRYNIGNDKSYLSEGRKISLGSFGVQHTPPALKLDPKFYRTNYTEEELRYFHRPSFDISYKTYSVRMVDEHSEKVGGTNTKLSMKLHKDLTLEKDPIPIKKSTDLTLNDSSNFVVFEYSEERPFFIVNPGMASLMNTYYRKSDTIGSPTPEGCIVLEPEEEAPFFGFGDIKCGSFVRTLTNNLFISAIFPHTSKDYLCIETEGTIMVRPIENVFLVGQILPKEEVFAPHSRKLNQFCKDRLKVAAHRAFAKEKALMMSDLDQIFPYFSEGSKRKWLKEYADCVKKGKENLWIPKETCIIASEEELRKIVSPENICQYESMLEEEYQMGIKGIRFVDNEDEELVGGYCPNWVLSRNFVNATNGRGLLEVFSGNTKKKDEKLVGDATTAIDDDEDVFFSFRRVRLKRGNEAENRKIIAKHQSLYRERIESVWKRQINMFSSTEPVEYEYTNEKKISNHGKEVNNENTKNDSEVLIIKRTYINEKGEKTVKKEILKDKALIQAYLRARKKNIEKKTVLTCSKCGQSGHMKTNKGCPNYMEVMRSSKKKQESEKRKARLYLQDIMAKQIGKYMMIPYSNAFHRPVSTRKFPDYTQIVKNPIDMSTIKAKVKGFAYKTYDMFVDDFRLMLENCILYNGKGHSLTEIAESIYVQVLEFRKEQSERIENAEQTIQRLEQIEGGSQQELG